MDDYTVKDLWKFGRKLTPTEYSWFVYYLKKFKRLAMNVWGVSAEGQTDEQIAMEGLETMEQWMRELGLAMNITDCGAKPELIEGMADACPICQGGYYILNRDEVVQVLKESL